MYLMPSDIFFSQDSINNVFDKNSSHRYKPIGETLDALCDQRCYASDIPTISVMKRDNKWYTADNRRLWVFRHLERLGKCEEIYVRETYYISSSKFTTYNEGVSIEVRGSPGVTNTISASFDNRENALAVMKNVPVDRQEDDQPFKEQNGTIIDSSVRLRHTVVCIEQNDLENSIDSISKTSENSESIESQRCEYKGFNSSSETPETPVSKITSITKCIDSNIDIINDTTVHIDMSLVVDEYENKTETGGHKKLQIDTCKKKWNICKTVLAFVVFLVCLSVLLPV